MSSNKSRTNALRMLDKKSIAYESIEYNLEDGFTSGSDIARMQGLDPDSVFKTLVTEANTGEHFVCVIPVDCALDLKKAAKYFGTKRLEMLPMKKLLPITGYVHGGCSPIGMKKDFRTAIDEVAGLFDEIYVSGGRIGLQLKIGTHDLCSVTGAGLADLTL